MSREAVSFFFFQAEDGIRVLTVTGVQTCALPISAPSARRTAISRRRAVARASRRFAALAQAISSTRATAPDSIRRRPLTSPIAARSEEHTSELQSQSNLVCRLLLEKKKKT